MSIFNFRATFSFLSSCIQISLVTWWRLDCSSKWTFWPNWFSCHADLSLVTLVKEPVCYCTWEKWVEAKVNECLPVPLQLFVSSASSELASSRQHRALARSQRSSIAIPNPVIQMNFSLVSCWFWCSRNFFRFRCCCCLFCFCFSFFCLSNLIV